MATEDNENKKPSDDTTHATPGTPDHTVMIDVPRELGSYRLTRVLGRGGMGEVWLAFDKHLERDVAIKVMRKELLTNEDATRRFAREARAVARLNHPNIVQVYAFGDEKGILYFVMELVEGETVAQRMKRQGHITLDDAIGIMMQSIEGLGYACERGIIHRDIKPSNLMVTPDGRVKIADFGLAKMVEHDTQMTAAGTAMGSPNYMSPEQARGEEADHRSDIYALGISLYQMLCGGLPFVANSPVSVLLKHIQEPLPEPDDLRCLGQGAVLHLIKRMTAKRPQDRFQSYTDLAAALAGLAPDRKFIGAHSATGSMPATPRSADSPTGSGGVSGATVAQDHVVLGAGDSATIDAHGIPPAPPVAPPVSTAPPESASTPVPPAQNSETADGKSLIWAAVGLLLLCVVGVVVGLLLIPDFDKINNPDTLATPMPSPVATSAVTATPMAQSSPASPTAPVTANSPTPAVPVPTPGVVASPASSPVVRGTMQPVNLSATLGTPTPFPGVVTSPTPTPNLADLLPSGITLPSQSSQQAVYMLGTKGAAANEMVPAYRDKDGKVLYKEYPAGTNVSVIDSSAVMLRVMTPDNQALYVYKKMVQRK